jgi:serine/threonine protein kinase
MNNMANYEIRKLHKNTLSSRNETNNKYYLSDCSDRITTQTPTTEGWIKILNTLKMPLQEYDKSRILLGVLENHHEIVVKIGDDNSIQREYQYARKVYHIKGFVKFICYFECNDTFTKYPDKTKNSLCNGVGSTMKIILMPYFPLGSIGFYSWADDEIHVLQSCIKHAFLSYINAFMCGYLHGDFHPGNVLLKTTKQITLDYDLDGIGKIDGVETNGIRTWIMDFENMREISRDNKSDIMDFYFDIQKFIILLQDHRFIHKIDKRTFIPISKIIQKNMMAFPNMNFIEQMMLAIDGISFISE